MKTIGVFEAKTHLSKLLTDVENNEEYIIQRRGRNIAVIQPIKKIDEKESNKNIEKILSAFKNIRESQGDIKKPVASTKKMINDGRKY